MQSGNIELEMIRLILIKVYNSKKVINIALKNKIGQFCWNYFFYKWITYFRTEGVCVCFFFWGNVQKGVLNIINNVWYLVMHHCYPIYKKKSCDKL